jgi:LacI family transcriptional regulator
MQEHRRPTMADVGRLAGVSATTVSFVVNGRLDQSISEPTRKRVMDAVAALGYRPNRAALGLRTKRTATIGFVSDEIGVDPFAGHTILGAQEVAWAHGSMVLVVNTTRDPSIVRDVIDELVARSVEAIIFAVVGTRRITVPEGLKGVPAVLLNGYTTEGVPPCVLPDDVEGGRRAAQLVLAQGHRRIAYLTGLKSVWPTKARLRGFRQALTEAGVSLCDQVVLHGNYRPDSGYDLTCKLLARGTPPTAILCGNDRMATGAYLALAEAGLRIPQDVSVVGYDDQVELGEFFRPALSTIRLPYLEMGRWAAGQAISGKISQLPSRTYLQCSPTPRSSVAPPRGTVPPGAGRRKAGVT